MVVSRDRFHPCGAAWGRDPPDTKYSFEDDVSCHLHLRAIDLILRGRTAHADQTLVRGSLREPRLSNGSPQCSYFSGFKNKDVAFFHPASKTMLEADLLFNLPAREQVCVAPFVS